MKSPSFATVATAAMTMNHSHNSNHMTQLSALQQARSLAKPSREAMLRRDPQVQRYWHRFNGLFEKAWDEWATTTDEGKSLPKLDESLINPELKAIIDGTWRDPTLENESKVKQLFTEVSPGVYQVQLFDPLKLRVIREYIDKASVAGIPTRPPYGIVLNRKGMMIDPRSEGYMAIPAFQSWYRSIIDTYMRPIGRLLYPEYITEEDDSDSFAFTIGYQAGKDHSIRQHSDASSLTLNVNLNIPGLESYSGSSLYFVDPSTKKKKYVDFAPGVAIIHRGATLHAALPIESGERTNLVMWLYGKYGRANHYDPYDKEEQLTVEKRWTKPAVAADGQGWSPF